MGNNIPVKSVLYSQPDDIFLVQLVPPLCRHIYDNLPSCSSSEENSDQKSRTKSTLTYCRD